ncbi:hypothetical protein B1P92_02895 [Enterococcus faecium]|nr:hypothetical protein B1P92_02895 [Enterococcus faecium]
MMSKNNTNGRNQFAMLTIDDLVPQDHLVRIAAMNLKKLATWLWKGKEPLFFLFKNSKRSR